MVAQRFISGKIHFQGNVAAVAIALSFFVIIVAVAVSAGFRSSIREGLAAMTGDVSIVPYVSSQEDQVPMPRNLPSRERLLALEGVRSIEPVVLRAGIVKNGDIVHGVLVKGIQRPDSSMSVSIPRRLSAITGLGIGDPLTIYFIGEKVRVRKFTITAFHESVLEVDDNLLVYANLEDMQRLNGWTADQVSGLNLTLKDASPQKLAETAQAVGELLLTSGHPEEEALYVSSSAQKYPQIFDWLGLLDYNVLILLILMTVVAAFNMVSGLLIMVLRNIPLVGTLKTLGMTDRAIGGVFVRSGARAALKGMLAGNALALLFCLIQGTTHPIPLDPANYFVSWVPVQVSLPGILLADAAAFGGILLLIWIPTRVIARIDPAQTVKAD